ncbi:AMP-binding protein [Sphingopyxis sp.]|jgi:acetyl-CoA synthetase|uniref:AMP-binding protein n=1 Tax=Sphingopyxis sp. TaxID=1908224 RepID=UPI002DE20CCA|nr:AMP-binding protein [Sphingopyxis sp.]
MIDYQSTYDAFDLAEAQACLSRPVSGGLNAAEECCDRWCGAGRTALRWTSEDGRREDWTFEQLRDRSSRLANLLAAQGVAPGDRVAGLLPRTPELLVTILATWRLGAVYQPLFTAFGPKAIEHRLVTAGTRAIVTDPGNRSKLDGIDHDAPVISTANGRAGDVDLPSALGDYSPECAPVLRSAKDPFLIMFTSGTTGAPKSLLVPLKAIPAFVGYMRDAVGLEPEDRFWNVADPGWAYGLYYAVTGPLAMGQTTHFYSGAFTAESTVAMIRDHGITNLAGSPTAFRLLMAAGPEAMAQVKGQIRRISSAGEALNPEVARWFDEHLSAPVRDHYGQTELGMVVCNHHALDHTITAGSAGFSVPGHRVVVVDEAGNELEPHVPGVLAVDRDQSPLFWFGGYEQGGASGQGRYYLSGDVVERNDDGSLSFVGRADDVITSSGYRIGPFDVESALVEHPGVVEAAVVGKPDPERTELVKAFVVLAAGMSPSDSLKQELQQHVRARLSAHAYPREIEFVDDLPKTPSGKIQRFLLRAREKAASSQ